MQWFNHSIFVEATILVSTQIRGKWGEERKHDFYYYYFFLETRSEERRVGKECVP